MNNSLKSSIGAFLLLALGSTTNASTVLIQDGSVFSSSGLNSYYNSLSGVNSSRLSSGSALTSNDFNGVDLFVAAPPSNAYSASELAIIVNFIDDGGNALLLGENTGFPTENNAIRSVLSELGSSITVGNSNSTCGIRTATAPQLVGDTMSGVSSFEWGCATLLGGNGTTELLDENLTSVLMASEAIGLGDIVVMADGNISTSLAGNRQFFENLLTFDNGDSGGPPPVPGQVPIPAAVWLFGSAIAGFAGFSRFKKKS